MIGCEPRARQCNERDAQLATPVANRERLASQLYEVAGGEWIGEHFKGLSAEMVWAGVEAVIPMAELYDGVAFARRDRATRPLAREARSRKREANAKLYRSSHDVLDDLSVLIISVASRFCAHNAAIAIPQWAKP